jgi:hypothetical protein
MVVDPQGWVCGMRGYFDRFQVTHMRSPAEAHPHPFDGERLLEKDTEASVSLASVANKRSARARPGSRSKTAFNNTELVTLLAPTSKAFFEMCDDMVAGYHLCDVLKKDRVTDVAFAEGAFKVTLESGTVLTPKIVVHATGGSGRPNVPEVFGQWASQAGSALQHVLQLTHRPPACLCDKTVVVVGGGLCAADAVQLAIREGCRSVKLVVRASRFSVRPFDYGPEWMSAGTRNKHLFDLLSAPATHRVPLLRSFRGGASITPAALQGLQDAEARGVLTIVMATEISSASFENDRWSLNGGDITGDVVWLATGCKLDVTEDPILGPFLREHPIPTSHGLPILTPDLSWSDSIPLFVTGPLAAIQVGPIATNLMGSRAMARKIIESDLFTEISAEGGQSTTTDHALDFATSKGNKFALLSEM